MVLADASSWEYPEALAELMELDEAGVLDAGFFQDLYRSRLEQLTPAVLFAGADVVDSEAAECCVSGLWLLHHFLDESHRISQDIHTPSGSFWHGIMHRREGDYPNAKYWFRRVGDHPVFDLLAEYCQRELSEYAQPAAQLPLENGRFDPFCFVDQCESLVRYQKGDLEFCQRLARQEWKLLFEHCYGTALGQH